MRIILIAAFLLPSALARAEDAIPVPKKRPNILSVSPTYIEELKNRGRKSIASPVSELENDTETDIAPEQLSGLKPEAGQTEEIPLPKQKPEYSNDPDQSTQEQRLVSFSLLPQAIKLDKNLQSFLENHALDVFKNNLNIRLDIKAYATSDNISQSSDIRIALARALEVRKFLISHNIEPSRIKLSPLGNDQNNKSDDRIDLVFIDSAEENL